MAHMRNMAHRHRRAAAKMAAKFGPEMHDYVIVDPAHRPDLHGELAGAKVRMHEHKQIVRLTKSAARFYLDSGSIKLMEHHKQPDNRPQDDEPDDKSRGPSAIPQNRMTMRG